MDTEHLKERCRTFLEIMKLAVYIHRTQQCSLSEAFERAKIESEMPDFLRDRWRQFSRRLYRRSLDADLLEETLEERQDRFLGAVGNVMTLRQCTGCSEDEAWNLVDGGDLPGLDASTLKSIILGRPMYQENGCVKTVQEVLDRFYGRQLPSWRDAISLEDKWDQLRRLIDASGT